jgi:uncharacterized membrane protein
MVLAVSGPRRVGRSRQQRENVGDFERWISAMGGGALAFTGLRRRGWKGTALATVGAALLERGATGHCRVYQLLGVSTADRNGGDTMSGAAATVNARKAVKVEDSVTIMAPRAELYRLWRDFDNHPRFMSCVQSVEPQVDGRYRYELRLPGGTELGWTAEIVRDIPGELISWKTIRGSEVAHAGSVHFRDTDDGLGTVVTLAMDYEPPGGAPGRLLARMAGVSPEQLVRADLESFRSMAEQGAGHGSLHDYAR